MSKSRTKKVAVPQRDIDARVETLLAEANDWHAKAAESNARLKQIDRDTLTAARHVGERLVEIKRILGHGKWLPWLAANCEFTHQTANSYMRIAKGWDEIQEKAGADASSIRANLLFLSAPKLQAVLAICPPPEPAPQAKTPTGATAAEPAPADPQAAPAPAEADDDMGEPPAREVSPPPAVFDEVGVELPEKAVLAFAGVAAIKAACADIDAVLKRLPEIKATPAGGMLMVAQVQSQLKTARDSLWYTRPYAVCPKCLGVKPLCNQCDNRGWVTKRPYDCWKKEDRA